MAATTTKLRASTGKANRELVADLQRIGFSEYEARTYLSLLQVNPATAYEVSKHSGLPRANTYGALDALTQKRAVQPVTENPVRYAPVRPEVLLDRLSSDLNNVCDRLKDNLGALENDDRSDIVWSLSGQEQIERKINELIDGAKGHVWIKASTAVLRQHLDALQRAARRDVALVFVVFGQDTEFLELGPRSKVYLHEGNGVRIGGADNLFTVAIDYRVALTANVTGELTGAYTTNPSVVRMAETLIRHDFYMAEIMMAFPEQIGQRFGPNLVRLRQQMFSPDQLQTLLQNVRTLPAAPSTRAAATARSAARAGEAARADRGSGTRGGGATARRARKTPR
ncbi:MAG: TrmB family transcriptional regulator [Burkholderiaceae bacterium]|jgi:sugar-specific transcriptional regulator TrmB|nr:TrmB family transcriptional regulator [Burkholderiales bacterium]MCZ8101914.1 TrmB family transcriptional regulator [Burkholderiales bacterium]MCZ8338588.1 TrmB family transcriptional regulator [Burkholderiaceae bacterium]